MKAQWRAARLVVRSRLAISVSKQEIWCHLDADLRELFLEASEDQQVGFPGVDRMDRGVVDLALAEGLFDGEVVAVEGLASAAADAVAE